MINKDSKSVCHLVSKDSWFPKKPKTESAVIKRCTYFTFSIISLEMQSLYDSKKQLRIHNHASLNRLTKLF